MLKPDSIKKYSTYKIARYDTKEIIDDFDSLYEARQALTKYIENNSEVDEVWVGVIETILINISGFIMKHHKYYWSSPRLSQEDRESFQTFSDKFSKSLKLDLITAKDFEAH